MSRRELRRSQLSAIGDRLPQEHIRRYYDRHTSSFVALGQRGSDGAIHRAVWGPGTTSRRQAFRYVEDRIIELIRGLPPSFEASHVVDLGCGVGASLCYLAERLPIRGTGITLSPVQARLAEQRIRKAGFSDRIRSVEGDYCDLPADIEPADLAYAIESFVHGSTPARFFAQCGRLVRPGGLLLICDDFKRSTSEPAAARTIERFCQGWCVNALLERDELRALARAAGFEHESTCDLSPYLEIGRVRDRAIDVGLALFGWLPFVATRFDYLRGGSALQTCLENGWIGYDLAVFTRSGDQEIRKSGDQEIRGIRGSSDQKVSEASVTAGQRSHRVRLRARSYCAALRRDLAVART